MHIGKGSGKLMKFSKLKTKRLFSSYFFLQPAFLAFIVWIVLIFFLTVDFNKYKAEIVDAYLAGEESKWYFHDIQGDGQSEIVNARTRSVDEHVCVNYSDIHRNVIDQWNLRGDWLLNKRVVFGDYDHDDIAEVYCITQVEDSIFMHGKELMQEDGLEFEERFICASGTFSTNETDVLFIDAIMTDIDNDSYDDLVFILYSGFSKYPRNTFTYYIRQDSLVISPHSASGINHYITFMDINNDGVDEITGLVGSPENVDDDTPYTDSTSWLLVFEPARGMNFLFPPKRYDQGMGSYVFPEFFEISGEKYLAAAFINRNSESKPEAFSLKLFDAQGELIKEKRISYQDYYPLHFLNTDKKASERFYLIDKKGHSYYTDTSLAIKTQEILDSDLKYVDYFFPKSIDADGDGINEALIYGYTLRDILLIYRYDLTDPVLLDLPELKHQKDWHISTIKDTTKNKPILALQAGTVMYHIDYGQSQVYFLKYPFYLGLYVLAFLFFWLLQKLQNKLAIRRFETEKQLMRQQLAISKKQLEPHFMLNTLNNIGYLFMKAKHEKAQYYFGKFASLIHRSLQYADQVETSLQEELKFIRDYLELQKYRMGEDFSYEIKIEDDIDPADIKIPHSLLFTFVENAIKHGLISKEDEKLLNILIEKKNENIRIIIRDNGIGRQNSRELKTTGTGKGLLINKSIIASYNKLYEREIRYKVEDLVDEDGKGEGTVVEVVL